MLILKVSVPLGQIENAVLLFSDFLLLILDPLLLRLFELSSCKEPLLFGFKVPDHLLLLRFL